MAESSQHDFYRNVRLLAERLPESNRQVAEMALAIAAELTAAAPGKRFHPEVLPDSVGIDAINAAIDRHAPDSGDGMSSVPLRATLMMMLYQAETATRRGKMLDGTESGAQASLGA